MIERVRVWPLVGGCLFIVYLFAPLISSSVAQDTIGNRLAAAERYAEVFDFEKMLSDTIAAVAQNISPDKRAAYVDYMNRGIDRAKLRNLLVISLVEVFTTDELNALADFYGSPIGRSILKKFPQAMAVFTPALLQEILKTSKPFEK